MAVLKKFVTVKNREIAYLEEGKGDPIVLIHGNPTSSFLWRNIIPRLASHGRVIAPDLIGHGDSEKLPVEDGSDRYSFDVNYHFLNELFLEIGIEENIIFILHDWGSALGFHWAKNNSTAMRGIAYMEAIVCPLFWDDWPEDAVGIFKGFRSEKGEDLVLARNLFVEGVLPSSILRELTSEEMNAYRAPFLEPSTRQPTLNWPRQIPIEGSPQNMVDVVTAYGKFLETSTIPKLFINADPGSILTGRPREYCRTWSNQEEVTVRGLHFIQEDSPDQICDALSDWFSNI